MIAIRPPSQISPSGRTYCSPSSGCPPAPLPVDPEGEQVTMYYKWYRNSVEVPGATETWFDCVTNGCVSGDSLALSSVACDPYAACTESDLSPTVGVSNAVQGSFGDPTYSIYALALAFSLIALAYMATYLFGLPHLRPVLQDEILQVIATGAVLLGIVGVGMAIDGYLLDAVRGAGYTGTASNAMDAAQEVLVGVETKASTAFGSMQLASIEIGKQASKGVFCNLLGVGFTVVNCSPLNAFRGSITTSAFATAVSIADTYAQQFILSLARQTAFAFLIPLGLFLRCFKASRFAGGALVAIGFGFYTAYPLTIVATDYLLHPQGSHFSTPDGVPTPANCDPYEANVDVPRNDFGNYLDELSSFDRAENLAYVVLVRTLFLSILNLIITLGFIRAFAHIIGSDIDVSALARIS